MKHTVSMTLMTLLAGLALTACNDNNDKKPVVSPLQQPLQQPLLKQHPQHLWPKIKMAALPIQKTNG